MATVRYGVTVHVPAPTDARGLAELRAALERTGLDVTDLHIHGGADDDERWLHISASVDAISGYEARRVKGPAVFAAALSGAGISVEQDDLEGVLTPIDTRA